ncbi:MAG: hypothetical protein WEB88_02765 [Gemmatimonadota bacterium]
MTGRILSASRGAALGAAVALVAGCGEPVDPSGVYDLTFDLTPADMRAQLTIPGGDVEGGMLLLRGLRTQQFGSVDMVTAGDSLTLRFAPNAELRLGLRGDSVHGVYLLSSVDTILVRGVRTGAPPDSAVVAALGPRRQAPGVLSTDEQGDLLPTFGAGRLLLTRSSPDWRRHVLVATEQEGEGWAAPQALPFSGGTWNDRGAAFAPGDSLLVFSSDRPLPGDSAGGDWNLWSVARTADGWAEPAPLAINSDSVDFHPSISDDGTLYFSSRRTGGMGGADIWRAARGAAGWQEPANLGGGINGEWDEGSVFVAPDGSWLLVSVTERPGGLGSEDLWLAERSGNGWDELRNPGAPLNSFAAEYGATLETGGAALWFTSHRRGLADLYRLPLDEAGISGG